jgi:hypothetical protein
MLTQLQHLDLSNCDLIRGDILIESLKTLTQLQQLELGGCYQLTESMLAEIRKEFPNCHLGPVTFNT